MFNNMSENGKMMTKLISHSASKPIVFYIEARKISFQRLISYLSYAIYSVIFFSFGNSKFVTALIAIQIVFTWIPHQSMNRYLVVLNQFP